MKTLIAGNEAVFRNQLEETLVRWGYIVAGTRDGNEAWWALQAEGAPQLAILDWMMPVRGGGLKYHDL
jgi:CheY-like chemotaxis protein